MIPAEMASYRAFVFLLQRGPSPERVDAVHGHQEPEGAQTALLLQFLEHHADGVAGVPHPRQTLRGGNGTAPRLLPVLAPGASGAVCPCSTGGGSNGLLCLAKKQSGVCKVFRSDLFCVDDGELE